MQKLSLICFIGLMLGAASGFLFPGGSGGGGGCGCQPACSPPPACPQPSPCGGGCAKARAKGAKNSGSVPVADDMELRAQLAGFNLDDPSSVDTHSTQLKYFEKLGSEEQQHQTDQIPEVVAAIERSKNLKTNRFAPIPQAAAAVIVESTSAAPAVKVSDSTAAPEAAAPTKTSAEVTSAEESEATQTSKCNNDVLKKLMLENITDNSSESKHAINAIAEKKFAGAIDVICSRGHFSYVYSSNLYCEASKGEVTCIAFRQSV